LKIVVLDGYTLNPGDLSWKGIEGYGEVIVYNRTSPEQVVERAREADIVLTNKTPLRLEALEQLTSLRFIGVLATGYDVIDIKAAKAMNIVVTNVPGYGTSSVAQLVFALLLELSQNVGLHNQSVKNGEWSQNEDWCYWKKPMMELSGKTIGIVGYGRIGEEVAEIAHAFGMKIAAYRRTPSNDVPLANFSWVSLSELWETSDVISLHCPLSMETEGLINHNSLKQMKSSVYLINTARGKLIAEQDLADALNSGDIAGAALDVLSSEPPTKENPLLTAENCIITPHLAWGTFEARSRLMQIAADNIEAFTNGKSLNVVG
jgi:glycerate dehydrogenase